MTNQRINFAPSILPLSTVINQIKNVQRNGLDLQPSYQRGFIWNQEFKEKLIYSVIKRYPIGSISIRYLEEPNEKNAKSEVVDGQQRLTTLYHFITGTEDFKIRNEFARKIINEILSIFINEEQNDKKFQKLKTKFNHKGNIILRYEDLPSIIQDDIKSYPITISGISNATTEQISEYFRFLQNQEALRAGEILKSIPSSYLENYLRGIDLPNVEDKREAYYEKSIEYGNVLPKSKDYRFLDGTYMATWYNAQYKKVKELMKDLNQENYKLSKSNYDLLLWFNKLHTDLKAAWLDKFLGPQRREKNGEAYQRWSLLASEVDKNPKALKTKKLCEGIENFYSMEEFITGAEKRMGAMADELFPCSNTSIEEINKHLKLINR